MAHYTTTIKTLIDLNYDFGLTNYPIFDENYRQTLNQKILNHYYESEIGFETPALFKFYLNNKLNEIMPLYNIYYTKQKELLLNITKNVNFIENYQGDNTEKTNNSTSNISNTNINTNSNNKNLFQDTPQGELDTTDLDNQTYATNLSFDKNNSSSSQDNVSRLTGNSNSNGTSNYIKNIVGSNGSKYNLDILKDVQSNIMNIDLMIINELNDLFMGIF